MTSCLILVTGQSIGAPLHIFNIPTLTFSHYIYLHQELGNSCIIVMSMREQSLWNIVNIVKERLTDDRIHILNGFEHWIMVYFG